MNIVIFGSGDIAQLANYYFTNDTIHEVVAFTVDKNFKQADTFEGKPLIEFEEVIKQYPPDKYGMFIALSYASLNKIREEKFLAAKAMGYTLVSYVSSKCSYMSQFACGDNCFILEDNTIQPYVKIGDNVTLWSGNHIGHHSTIEDHNFISSHVVISGHCVVKSNCFIGVNATIHNGVTLEVRNIVGASAIITKSTKENEVWIPAKSIKIDKSSDTINL